MLDLKHSPIDAVIFDFGAVILDLDYAATERQLRALVGETNHYSKEHQTSVFDDLETGAINASGFHDAISKMAGKKLDPRAIDEAFCAMLLDINPKRFDFLRDTAKRRRIFLFSNTNEIHKAQFDKTLDKHLGGGNFDKLFEKAYYSHLIGHRKPNAAAYKYILDEQGLVAERTLFIDDNKENIAGAASVGLQTVHLTGELLDEPRLRFLVEG